MEQTAVCQQHDLLGQEVKHNVCLIVQCKDLREKNTPLHEIYLLTLEWTSLLPPKSLKLTEVVRTRVLVSSEDEMVSEILF